MVDIKKLQAIAKPVSREIINKRKLRKQNRVSKFLFLDIDGVMNHEDWFKVAYKLYPQTEKRDPRFWFDPECVKRINEILTETGARLVISSSWRFDEDLWKDFEVVGLPTFFDITPISFERWRGNEIKQYLDNVKSKYTYCIVDDDSFDILDEQKMNFVQTAGGYNDESLMELNGGTGLTETCKNRIIKILNHGK